MCLLARRLHAGIRGVVGPPQAVAHAPLREAAHGAGTRHAHHRSVLLSKCCSMLGFVSRHMSVSICVNCMQAWQNALHPAIYVVVIMTVLDLHGLHSAACCVSLVYGILCRSGVASARAAWQRQGGRQPGNRRGRHQRTAVVRNRTAVADAQRSHRQVCSAVHACFSRYPSWACV